MFGVPMAASFLRASPEEKMRTALVATGEESIGQKLDDAITDGLHDLTGDLVDDIHEEVDELAKEAKEWVDEYEKKAKEKIGGYVDDIEYYIDDKIGGSPPWMKKIFDKAGEKAKEAVGSVFDEVDKEIAGAADWAKGEVTDFAGEEIKPRIDRLGEAAGELADRVAESFQSFVREFAPMDAQTVVADCPEGAEAENRLADGNHVAGSLGEPSPWKLTDLKISGALDYLKDFFGDEEKKKKLKISADLLDETEFQFGDEDNNIKIGNSKADLKAAIDFENGEATASLEGSISVLELNGKIQSPDGSTVAGGKVTVGELAGKAELSLSSDGAKVEAGVEAVAVKAEGEIAHTLSSKSIWDNTIGAAIGYVDEDSDWAELDDEYDVGITVGAKGTAGIGAAAKVHGNIGRTEKGGYEASFGAKAGAGPMLGGSLFFRVE